MSRSFGPGGAWGISGEGGLLSLPYDQQVLYSMVKGDSAGDAASVSGITIVDGPTNGIWGAQNKVSGVKMLSPWFYGTDAFPFVSHIDHTFCFAGDEVFMPAFAGYQGEDMTITSCFAGTSKIRSSREAGGGWNRRRATARWWMTSTSRPTTTTTGFLPRRCSRLLFRCGWTTASRAPGIRTRHTRMFESREISRGRSSR